MTPVIAIYDIGKTNKKLMLYDSSYSLRWEMQTVPPEGVDDDGDACEDIQLLTDWIVSTWNDISKRIEFRIDALHFTAYGATFVHLDSVGKPVTPVYSYFKQIPERETSPFYKRYGGPLKFSAETASPPMGMLNSGLQLYWLKKEKPQLFSKIKTTLHLPNYCSYLFTGVAGSELTSLGCHTALWQVRRKQFHRWVKDECLTSLFPPVQSDIKIAEIKQNDRMIPIGIGLHDSSAALIPYLHSFQQPFILLSTGTWCINLYPFSRQPLTEYQLERDCLSYLTFQGSEVKASRSYLGGEHDHQIRCLADHFHRPIDTYKTIPYNPSLLEELLSRENTKENRLQPGKMQGTGPVPDFKNGNWDVSRFPSYEEAYHQLMLDLVCIICLSLDLINEGKRDVDLFIDGGFSKNKIFMEVLASLLPQANVRSSDLGQATSLGAALAMHPYWQGNAHIDEQMFNLHRYKGHYSENLDKYYKENYLLSS